MEIVRKERPAAKVAGNLDFVLSDGSIDRMGDKINPDGWKLTAFKRNPIALFNHKSNEPPIGEWKNIRVEDGKLMGRLVPAEEGTSDRIDELRALLDQGILRAASVGFLPIEFETFKENDRIGTHFTKQELLEVSIVSIPANANALAVMRSLNISAEVQRMVFGAQSEKDQALAPRRQTGAQAETPPARVKAMTGFAEKIQGAQARLVALKDQQAAHIAGLGDEPDEAANTITEELNAKIDTATRTLKALEDAESRLALATKTPDNNNGGGGGDAIIVRRPFATAAKPQQKGGLVMASLVALAVAKARNFSVTPQQVLAERYGSDGKVSDEQRAVFDFVTRAATAPADTVTSGWASQLATTQNAEFMALLMPASVYPGLSARGLRLNFGRSGVISIPSRVATPTIAGAFVLQGNPIPVKQGAVTAVTITPKKMAVISTFTRELSEHSTPAIETIIRDAMSEDTSVALDAVLLDATAASATRPAGIRNGVSVTTATAGGGFNALVGDLKNLVGALITATSGNMRAPTWIMNPIQALSISVTQNAGGDFPFAAEISQNRFQGMPVIVSSTVTAGMVILIDAADFVSVEGDSPRFEVSDQATLHMEDTTPLAIGTPGSPATVAAPTRSLWQTDSIGLRMIMDVNWAIRRTPAPLAWTQSVTW